MQQFAAEHKGLDYDKENNEIYLYHGTNCYRRWEINRTGSIEPGRNQHSFFTTSAKAAYAYARASCIRDLMPGSVNSLSAEPVVMKVKFNARTWVQVDFIQPILQLEEGKEERLTLAVLGPVLCNNIVDILHCTHGRRLGVSIESIKTFADGTFLESIRHLKEKLQQKRVDGWLLKKLGLMEQEIMVYLGGGNVPELSSDDHIRKLKQSNTKA
ncbi:MAG: hypothetical protein SFY67_11625 [Candidatus Melainabacteria bacterium]|nr:hypothetical protein [Candidatus Melainabacteria bacterium]